MTEPLTQLQLFALPEPEADAFVGDWPTRAQALADVPGFREARLYRAVAPGNPYPIIQVTRWNEATEVQDAEGSEAVPEQSALYRVVSVTPDPLRPQGTDTFTLVNLFTLPAQAVDAFVAGWPTSTAGLAQAPGFRGTRLHRAVSPDAAHQIVNMAQWDSIEAWQAALAGFQPQGERRAQAERADVRAQPSFYRVVARVDARREPVQ